MVEHLDGSPGHMPTDDPGTGGRIRAFRHALDWSQVTLARKVGFTAQKLNKIESGKQHANDEDLKKLADVLGVSVDALLGRSRRSRPKPGLAEGQAWSAWTPLRGSCRRLQVILVSLREQQYSMA